MVDSILYWYFNVIGGLIKFKKREDGTFDITPIHSNSGISLLLIDSMLPKNTAAMILARLECKEYDFIREDKEFGDVLGKLAEVAGENNY